MHSHYVGDKGYESEDNQQVNTFLTEQTDYDRDDAGSYDVKLFLNSK